MAVGTHDGLKFRVPGARLREAYGRRAVHHEARMEHYRALLKTIPASVAPPQIEGDDALAGRTTQYLRQTNPRAEVEMAIQRHDLHARTARAAEQFVDADCDYFLTQEELQTLVREGVL